ncbi:hypothetical protein EYV94_18820 [Puteibacter caeruleilacunae]|nr:hypothetical protein EYV94_18820 [Puteibacter caeruleilacunae]
MNDQLTKYACIIPEPSCLEKELEYWRDEMKKLLSNDDYQLSRISFFINTTNWEDYIEMKEILSKETEALSDNILFDVIAQPPAGGQTFTAECAFFHNSINIEHKTTTSTYYQKVTFEGHTEIHAFGLTGGEHCKTEACSLIAFKKMEEILKAEDLEFGDVVRQWNYIEHIIEINQSSSGMFQNYQIFNDVRSNYYSTSQFTEGYPAATGIGTSSGGVIISFIAVKPTEQVKVIPVINPRQVDAHQYSQQVLVGEHLSNVDQRTSPKFERAKLVSGTNQAVNYISGTAAIIGEDTIPVEDYKQQTIETLENIKLLIKKKNPSIASVIGKYKKPTVGYLRVYINKPEHFQEVKTVCEELHPDVAYNYVIGDVCRDNLLVEIEGVYHYKVK